MKKIKILVITVFCSLYISAANPPNFPDDAWKLFAVMDQQPEFPGGSSALKQWIEKTLHYPVTAEEQGLEARVVAAFWVTGDGTVRHGKIIHSGGALFDKEVLRVIRWMPRWKPGRENGRPVSVRYTIPFIFHIKKDTTNFQTFKYKYDETVRQ